MMNIDMRKTWPMAIAFAMLTGCATDPRVGPDGQVGYLNSYYSVNQLRNNPPRCLAALTPAQIEAGTYAEITVHHGRSSRYVSALVPPSIKPGLRDKVEIAPAYCKDGAVPTVRQILSGEAPSNRPHRDDASR